MKGAGHPAKPRFVECSTISPQHWTRREVPVTPSCFLTAGPECNHHCRFAQPVERQAVPYRRPDMEPGVGNRSSGGSSRALSWAAYSVTARGRGLKLPIPDVVYASSPHLLAGLSGLVLARARRAHFVFEVRDLWPQVLVDMGFTKEGSLLHRTLRAFNRPSISGPRSSSSLHLAWSASSPGAVSVKSCD